MEISARDEKGVKGRKRDEKGVRNLFIEDGDEKRRKRCQEPFY
jgi:hypothetical protein